MFKCFINILQKKIIANNIGEKKYMEERDFFYNYHLLRESVNSVGRNRVNTGGAGGGKRGISGEVQTARVAEAGGGGDGEEV